MQSRRCSIIETAVNMVSGFAVAQLLILYLLPFWGFQTTIHDSLSISAVFTSVSFLRGYINRRIFNHYNHPLRHTKKYIRKHYKNANRKSM